MADCPRRYMRSEYGTAVVGRPFGRCNIAVASQISSCMTFFIGFAFRNCFYKSTRRILSPLSAPQNNRIESIQARDTLLSSNLPRQEVCAFLLSPVRWSLTLITDKMNNEYSNFGALPVYDAAPANDSYYYDSSYDAEGEFYSSCSASIGA
jgi:hypothetical protein